MGMFLRRSHFIIIIEEKINKNLSQIMHLSMSRPRGRVGHKVGILRWFPHNIRAIMAKIKLPVPKNPHSMVIFWIKVRRSYHHLKCPYRQKFYFLIRSYIPCNEPWRKKFSIWIKSDLFMSLKRPENPIFLRSTRAADHMIDMLRVVT